MSYEFTPTSVRATALRSLVVRLQAQLLDAQEEAATGRVADLGRELGARTSVVAAFEIEHSHLGGIADSNLQVSSRLSVSQLAVESLSETATRFQATLLAMRQGDAPIAAVASEARSNLALFESMLNTSHDGIYVFAGMGTDTRPARDLTSANSSARAAIAAAFVAEFGMNPADAGVANLTPEDMTRFLDGPFSAMFEDASWKQDWSTAFDAPLRNRVAPSLVITTSVTANEAAFRQFAAASVMVAELGLEQMNAATRDVVLARAGAIAGQSVTGLIGVSARLGDTQARIEEAGNSMEAQLALMEKARGKLETVDLYEAATALEEVTRKLEVSYSLTGRLQRLSLLDHI